jgi:hypothetical protein
MRALPVVVQRILGKDAAQVLLAEDQHPVGDFGADGQHEAFGEAVRPRTPRRNPDLWVPATLSTSGDLLIFVKDAAEPVVSFDLVNLGWRTLGERS